MRNRAAWIFVLAALWPPGPAWGKIGLAARFGDVILEGAQPGRTYNLREAARVPLGVSNIGDADMEVSIVFERPKEGTLSEDFEVVPDFGWFKALPDSLRIPAHSSGFFDVLLSVPDDPKLVGRHFQVQLTARGGGVGLFGVGVENRVRVSIGPGPESVKAEKKRKAMQQLDFDVTPKDLYLTGIEPGKAWDSRREAKKTVRVANYAQDRLSMQLSVEAWDARWPLPQGYEKIPDPGWLRVKTSTVVVEAEGIGQASLVVEVPDKPENRGKRWVAMVRAGLTGGFWLDAPVKVYMETNGP